MKLLKYPNSLLTTICKHVDLEDPIQLAMLAKSLDEMAVVMKENKGIGLAANQVGIPLRFFIMQPTHEQEILELVNPVWLPIGEDKAGLKEGCLSSKNLYEMVPGRYRNIIVKYSDRQGFEHEKEFTGIDAVCIQHEVDHLDGIFWVDRLPRSKKRKLQRLLK